MAYVYDNYDVTCFTLPDDICDVYIEYMCTCTYRFKGTRELQDCDKYEISRDGDHHVLVVRDAYGEDEDEYSCRASNRAGARMSRADLTIKCASLPISYTSVHVQND